MNEGQKEANVYSAFTFNAGGNVFFLNGGESNHISPSFNHSSPTQAVLKFSSENEMKEPSEKESYVRANIFLS